MGIGLSRPVQSREGLIPILRNAKVSSLAFLEASRQCYSRAVIGQRLCWQETSPSCKLNLRRVINLGSPRTSAAWGNLDGSSPFCVCSRNFMENCSTGNNNFAGFSFSSSISNHSFMRKRER